MNIIKGEKEKKNKKDKSILDHLIIRQRSGSAYRSNF